MTFVSMSAKRRKTEDNDTDDGSDDEKFKDNRVFDR